MWGTAHLAELAVLGLIVGAVNAAGGGGGLVIFPALVAFGVPALTANHTNTVAQSPSYVAIAGAYRRELRGQGARLAHLLPAVALGGGAGLAALQLASASTFREIAPVLVALSALLLALQPRVTRAVAIHRTRDRAHPVGRLAVAAASAYAAYFGLAGGVLMLGVLAIAFSDTLQRINALNRLIIAIVNVGAMIVFIVVGPVSWPPVAVLIPTTSLGGWLGVSFVRRLDPTWLRALQVLIGVAASAYMIGTTWL
jgi:hypothetical protein